MAPEPIRSTARLRRLGRALRQARHDAELTLEEAGRRLERSAPSLSKIETGRVAVAPRDLPRILEVYDVPAQLREPLIQLARDALRRGWWDHYGTILSQDYLDYLSLETDAAQALTFEPVLIPGLLQSRDYARAIIANVPDAGQSLHVSDLLAVHATRQEALTRRSPAPLRLHAVITEGALRQQIGGPEVWRDQMRHLDHIAHLDNVDVRILPFTAPTTASANGPFLILRFPDLIDLDQVLIENPTGGLYLEEEKEVRRYRTLFSALENAALPPEATCDVIARLIEDQP
ncbi:helix-turn-helix domain-containing protein [Actinomadura viridis]|uniref:helix-turn-helix domain-containing protein n=1 Tax=Actinomadura viridis TaxID=58110 RepID=UPI0036821309